MCFLYFPVGLDVVLLIIVAYGSACWWSWAIVFLMPPTTRRPTDSGLQPDESLGPPFLLPFATRVDVEPAVSSLAPKDSLFGPDGPLHIPLVDRKRKCTLLALPL